MYLAIIESAETVSSYEVYDHFQCIVDKWHTKYIAGFQGGGHLIIKVELIETKLENGSNFTSPFWLNNDQMIYYLQYSDHWNSQPMEPCYNLLWRQRPEVFSLGSIPIGIFHATLGWQWYNNQEEKRYAECITVKENIKTNSWQYYSQPFLQDRSSFGRMYKKHKNVWLLVLILVMCGYEIWFGFDCNKKVVSVYLFLLAVYILSAQHIETLETPNLFLENLLPSVDKILLYNYTGNYYCCYTCHLKIWLMRNNSKYSYP